MQLPPAITHSVSEHATPLSAVSVDVMDSLSMEAATTHSVSSVREHATPLSAAVSVDDVMDSLDTEAGTTQLPIPSTSTHCH